jgi:predicted Zn-dependent peptidase
MGSGSYVKPPFEMIKGKLSSGTTLMLLRRPGLLRKTALVALPFGALLRQHNLHGINQTIPAGTAHFLEHQLFRMKDGSNVSDFFAALGVQDNAFTYFDLTAYHFRCTAYFSEALHLLLSFLSQRVFDADAIALEKEIITQEILMYNDLPDVMLDLKLRQALFGDHPAAEDIGGTVASIKEITPQILQLVHECYYSPHLAILVIIADLEFSEAVALAEEALSSVTYNENFSHEKAKSNQTTIPAAGGPPLLSRIEHFMPVVKPLLALGYKEEKPTVDGYTMLKRQLESEMLLDTILGKGSDFYWELQARGLINSNFSYGYQAADSFAYARISGECETPELLYDHLMLYLNSKAKTAITSETVSRLKKRYLGEYVLGYEGLESLAFDLVTAQMQGVGLESFPEIILKITKASLEQRYDELLTSSQASLALVDEKGVAGKDR